MKDRPVHRVVVPPAADGRPGFALLSPSRPRRHDVVLAPGHRLDVEVLLSMWSTLTIESAGRVADLGEPRDWIDRLVHLYVGSGLMLSATEVAPDRLAGEDGWVTTMSRLGGLVLHQWVLAHEGWLFEVTVAADEPLAAALPLARKSLDTLVWASAPAGTVPAVLAPAGAELRRSVELAHPPAVVWAVLRDPAHAARITRGIDESFLLPGSPIGPGEWHCEVVRHDACEHRVVSEIVQEEPFRTLVLRMVLPVSGTVTRWDLEEYRGGTRVQVAHRVAWAADDVRGREQPEVVRAALEQVLRDLHDYLDRLPG